MVVKTLILLSTYIGTFILMLFTPLPVWSVLVCWAIMGFAVAGIGMSVMHDANHGAYSNKSWVNNLIGYTLNLCGGAVLNWKLQHNVLHHTYTNVTHYDDDIEDKPVLRFSPHTKSKSVHRTQFVHAFLFYSLLTLYWVVGKDFVQYFKYTKNGVNKNSPAQNRIFLLKIILIKTVYLGIIIGLPVYLGGYTLGLILAGFLLMHAISGIVLTVIFQLAHSVEGTEHPLPDDLGKLENNWAIHQMITTVNFSPDNKLLSWYVGGLNYQVEHHLFPNICHVHYPALAPIVKQTAEEFGVPYQVNPTFWQAVKSHIALLQKFGRPSANEAIA